MTDEDVAAAFERLPSLINGNESLVRRGRFLSTVFLIGAGEVPVYVTVTEGRIADVVRGPVLMRSWGFAIHAGADAWTRFWQPMPEPGYHDLLAMARFGHARIEGELQPLMAHLRYVKDVLEAPRHTVTEASHAG